jgi:AAA domain
MFSIRQAERRQAKLRLALTGTSGSGKSLGAINLAAGMGKKFVVIDTEHRSADLYADVAKFDVLTLDKPFTPEKYIQAINYCESQGYEIIIVDSLSHAWSGEGGALDMHDAATQASPSKNSYMAWKEITPWQNKLVNTIIQSTAHIIVTMRVKTHYDVVDVGGKKRPIKIGLSPIQKDGLEYEFTCVLSMDKDSYLYTSSKDRTSIFEGKHEKLSQDSGKRIMEWLESGKSIEESQKEEISMLRDNLISCVTLESLRSVFKMAKDKYPSEANSFLKIANERSELLKAEGEMVS